MRVVSRVVKLTGKVVGRMGARFARCSTTMDLARAVRLVKAQGKAAAWGLRIKTLRVISGLLAAQLFQRKYGVAWPVKCASF